MDNRTIDCKPRELLASTPLQQVNLATAIQAHAERQPDRPALVASGFAPFSYRELQILLGDIRASLRASGLGRSARIAIAMPNGPHAALAIVAIACSAVSIPLNPKQTLREIEMSFATLTPDAVLLFKDSDSVVRRVADRLGIKILDAERSNGHSLGLRIDGPQSNIAAAASNEPDEPDPEAPAFILQTSGTTAQPKLIPTSHRNMLASAARVQGWFDLTPEDRCLCASPVFYAHGLHVMIFTPFLTGGSVALPTDTTRFDYSEWLGALKPTWYSASPTLHRLVFDQTKSQADAASKHALRFILSGGAPLPRDLLEGLHQVIGVPVVEH
jgi:oxalate---CoA ligase